MAILQRQSGRELTAALRQAEADFHPSPACPLTAQHLLPLVQKLLSPAAPTAASLLGGLACCGDSSTAYGEGTGGDGGAGVGYAASAPPTAAATSMDTASRAASGNVGGGGLPADWHGAAEAALHQALRRCLSASVPDYALAANTLRRLLALAGSDEARLVLLREAAAVLSSLPQGAFPVVDAEWLIASAWNKGAHHAACGRCVRVVLDWCDHICTTVCHGKLVALATWRFASCSHGLLATTLGTSWQVMRYHDVPACAML